MLTRRQLLMNSGVAGALALFLLHEMEQAAKAADTNVIYLTFDDGYVGTTRAVSLLNELGVRGTFFMVGQAIEWHTREAVYMVNSGHSLYNHTYDHKILTTLSDEGIAWELARCEAAAVNYLGVSTRPYFHAPGFASNNRVRAVARQQGFYEIFTDWNTSDWAGTSVGYIANLVRPGIVTLHTQAANAIPALRYVVPLLLDQGYQFAAL